MRNQTPRVYYMSGTAFKTAYEGQMIALPLLQGTAQRETANTVPA